MNEGERKTEEERKKITEKKITKKRGGGGGGGGEGKPVEKQIGKKFNHGESELGTFSLEDHYFDHQAIVFLGPFSVLKLHFFFFFTMKTTF